MGQGAVLLMNGVRTNPPPRDGLLWGLSLVAALVVNAAAFFAFAVAGLSEKEPPSEAVAVPPEKLETLEFTVATAPNATVTVATPEQEPEAVQPAEPEKPAEPVKAETELSARPQGPEIPLVKPRFARTSDDQASTEAPANTALIGERNTLATSERAPGPDGAMLPSQAGVGSVRGEVETVEGGEKPAALVPETPAEKPAAASPPKTPIPLDGPDVVTVPGAGGTAPDPAKPAPAEPPVETKPRQSSLIARKTEVGGSVSRMGVAAKNVMETPLGRFEAAVTQAVEIEWLRRCKQYQPYITPGYMAVRFVVGQDGKIQSITQVEAVECTDTQRSFTNDSIRAAKLPPMPAELKRKLGKEPLTLTIRFTFPETK